MNAFVWLAAPLVGFVLLFATTAGMVIGIARASMRLAHVHQRRVHSNHVTLTPHRRLSHVVGASTGRAAREFVRDALVSGCKVLARGSRSSIHSSVGVVSRLAVRGRGRSVV